MSTAAAPSPVVVDMFCGSGGESQGIAATTAAAVDEAGKGVMAG